MIYRNNDKLKSAANFVSKILSYKLYRMRPKYIFAGKTTKRNQFIRDNQRLSHSIEFLLISFCSYIVNVTRSQSMIASTL